MDTVGLEGTDWNSKLEANRETVILNFTIIRDEHIQLLRKRNTIRLSMAPPSLVVEIVSPGELQRDRDYIAERMQYQDRAVPEYWVIDPQQKTVLVLELTGGVYTEVNLFQGTDPIRSSQFENLSITASQLFAAGDVAE